MSARDALLREGQILDKLYDAESMMHIPNSIAKGFVVLMTGTETGETAPANRSKKSKAASRKSKTKERDVSLAFMALVQGNVLDACFGVANASRREDTPASRASKLAKELIEDSATNERFRVCAVDAYCEAFKAVSAYRTQYEKLNCITRCWKTKKLQTVCEAELREAFLSLAKAIAEQH